MKNKIIAACALLVIAAANAVVWFARPTAEPAYPGDVSAAEIAQTSDKPKPAKPKPSASKASAGPTAPLIQGRKPEAPDVPEKPAPKPPLEQSSQ